MKKNGIIYRAWMLQIRITLKYEHWIFWTGRRFVLGLFGASLLGLFIASVLYYWIDTGLGFVELFVWFYTTKKILIPLNPIMVLFYSFMVFFILFASRKSP